MKKVKNMDELMHTLWEYAAACRLEGCYDLEMKREREEGETMAGQNRERLEELGTAAKELKNLWESLDVVRSVDMEAAFVCGLRLGLDLR